MLAAGMICAANSKASAIDVQMDGVYNFQFTQARALQDGNEPSGKMDAATQFVEVGMTFTASENLSGYFKLWSKWEWGLDTDDVESGEGKNSPGGYPNAYVKLAYIDWKVPGTPVQIRMGRQEVELPAVALGKNPAIWSSDPSDGIAVSADINDNFAVSGFWTRYDRRHSWITSKAQTADVFALLAELKFEGFSFQPYVAFAAQDTGTMQNGNDTSNALTPGGENTPGEKYRNQTYWAGINGEMSLFDPLTVKADFVYGDRDFSSSTGLPSQHGYWFDGAISYKTDFGTPELAAWYGSGDDKNVAYPYQENMPTLCGRFGGSYGFFNGSGLEDNWLMDNHTGLGTWGVRLAMSDISFLEDLSHTIAVVYASGTNANDNAGFGLDPWKYMTHKDSIVEFDFSTTYEIYKNLSAYLEVAYVIENFKTHNDGAFNARSTKYDNGWQVALQLTYEF